MYKDLSVYIHIPFCIRKCSYCDFASKTPKDGELTAYKNALCAEIRQAYQYADRFNIKTIFIGGGTPSIYEPGVVSDILSCLRETFEKRRQGSYIPYEITIECNPGTISEPKLISYKEAGINRLSIGLQSADDSELKLLGRIHTYSEWEESMSLARKYGFSNINTDIISGIPYQTVDSFKETLKKVVSHNPEHISVYSLIIEEGTPFYEMFGPGKINDDKLDLWEERDRRIYEFTNEYLSSYGYNRYEISNYAKPGYECAHNLVYWRRGDYLGFGLSAASMTDNVRFAVTDSLSEYLNAGIVNIKSRQALDKNSQMSEYMFLGLRLTNGVSVRDFFDTFKTDIFEVYKEPINKWSGMGLLTVKDGRIFCSEKGFNICNMIMADFLL